jgi:3-oxoacyl-[acyl-carrier protein] reductase
MKLDPEIIGAFTLEGRVAVITGAASGLGREAARIFALAGASVVLADIDAKGLEETAALVRNAGGTATIQPTNIAKREEVDALAQAAVNACGRLDIWVNCAGITIWHEVINVPPAEAERVIGVNMMGTFWSCMAAGRIMKEHGGGVIINVSSTAGSTPVTGLSVYGMTKAAVEQLTRVCAMEMGASGVRVNAVAPGWIDTPINNSMYLNEAGELDEQRRSGVKHQMASMTPLNMSGEAIDIGLAMLYLASPASRFVTGQVWHVNGGVSI